MKVLRSLLLVISFLNLSQWIFPLSEERQISQFLITSWTREEGLPADNILDIAQDSNGYIWMASYDGIIRFDGLKFLVMNKASVKEYPASSARKILVFRDNSFWIGTNAEGLIRYDKNGFTLFSTAQGLPDDTVQCLLEDSRGDLWAGTNRGLCRISGQKIFPETFPPLAETRVNMVYEDREGVLFAAAGTLLYRNGGTGWEEMPYNFGEAEISHMLEDSRGRYWISLQGGDLFVLEDNRLEASYSNKEHGFNAVNDLLESREGAVWCATDQGLVRFVKDRIELYQEDQGLVNNQVESLFEDREGNIWAGTSRGGLIKITEGKFLIYSQDEGLSHNIVNTIGEVNEREVWIGTNEGLNIFREGRFVETPLTRRLEGARIRHLMKDSRGRVWISTYTGEGALSYDLATGEVEVYTPDRGLGSNKIRVILEDSRKDIWIGTRAGLSRLRGEEITTYVKELTYEYVLSLFEDSRGGLWIGTDGGGVNYLYDEQFFALGNSDGLAGDVVFDILEDDTGNIWVSTQAGISIITGAPGSWKIRNLTVEAGLPTNTIFQLILDGKDQFWAPSNGGIYYFSRREALSWREGESASLAVRVYNRNDGLKGAPNATALGIVDSSGRIWFPTLKGAAVINPLAIPFNEYEPITTIEKVVINNREYNPGDVGRLAPGTNRITFYFNGLSFIVPGKVTFRYQLMGFDKEWGHLSEDRQASYTNLRPGKYAFRVRAANSDNVWTRKDAVVEFYQEPFFFETFWFFVIVVILAAGLGFLFYVVRVNRLKRHQQELETQVLIKTRDLVKEKEKADKLLLNILPGKVASDLKEKGYSEPRVFENVTILFSDIVDFTRISSGLTPEEIISELNDIFTTFDSIIEKNHCQRIKTVGDGYLAVCGMPEENDLHAENIMKSALEISSYMKNRGESGIYNWSVRLGIHTGHVVGGVVGIKKYIYDVFGDAINTAARMEALSEPFRVNVSRESYVLLKDKFHFQARPPLEIKGKGIMQMYFGEYK